MPKPHLSLREYLGVQKFLAEHSPPHRKHFRQETGHDSSVLGDLLLHFTLQNHHGHSFASVFARLYRRYEAEILSPDNVWYAGIFFGRSPTKVETALYYTAYHHGFGLSLEQLPPLLVDNVQ